MNLKFLNSSGPVLLIMCGMPAAAFEPVIVLASDAAHPFSVVTTVHAAGGVFDVAVPRHEILATWQQNGGQVRVMTMANKAGQGAGIDNASATGAEALYVLDGTFVFHVGDRVFEGGPGTFMAVESGLPHSYVGKTDGRLLVMVSGVEQNFSADQAAHGPELGRLQGSYAALAR